MSSVTKIIRLYNQLSLRQKGQMGHALLRELNRLGLPDEELLMVADLLDSLSSALATSLKSGSPSLKLVKTERDIDVEAILEAQDRIHQANLERIAWLNNRCQCEDCQKSVHLGPSFD